MAQFQLNKHKEVGYQEVKDHEKAQKEKVDAVEKKKQERKRKEHEDLVRRLTQAETMVFSGSLTLKNKTDLGDLTSALGLETEGLTVSKLCSKILKYFDDHPEMKEDPWYSGIFTHTHKHPAPIDNENIPNHANDHMQPSPAQRRHLETIPLNALSPSSSSLTSDSGILQQPSSSLYPVSWPSFALLSTDVPNLRLVLHYPQNHCYTVL